MEEKFLNRKTGLIERQILYITAKRKRKIEGDHVRVLTVIYFILGK